MKKKLFLIITLFAYFVIGLLLVCLWVTYFVIVMTEAYEV